MWVDSMTKYRINMNNYRQKKIRRKKGNDTYTTALLRLHYSIIAIVLVILPTHKIDTNIDTERAKSGNKQITMIK